MSLNIGVIYSALFDSTYSLSVGTLCAFVVCGALEASKRETTPDAATNRHDTGCGDKGRHRVEK
jgi:hypothetical protein